MGKQLSAPFSSLYTPLQIRPRSSAILASGCGSSGLAPAPPLCPGNDRLRNLPVLAGLLSIGLGCARVADYTDVISGNQCGALL